MTHGICPTNNLKSSAILLVGYRCAVFTLTPQLKNEKLNNEITKHYLRSTSWFIFKSAN